MDNFFPSADYKVPSTSNYMKFSEGENTFRILSSAVIGWEYWTEDNKPIRSKIALTKIPDDIKMDENGDIQVNHFWAFTVWNYEEKRIQILELTQKGVMKTMQGYIKNEKWGQPNGYDFVITKTGSGMATKYATSVNPHSEIPEDAKEAFLAKKINLEALFDGSDPFTDKKGE
mgnify:CR=1 FL=1